MSIADRLIPLYVRGTYGLAVFSFFMSMINIGAVVMTLLTVKGYDIPLWMLSVLAVALTLFFFAFGWVMEKYDIANRIQSHANTRMNPEIKRMCEDIKEIRRILESKECEP